MKKELTTSEALNILYNHEDLQGGHDEYWKAYRFIEKQLQALEIIKNRILIDEDMGIIETKEEPSFGKVANLHSITFQILSDEEDYDLVKKVLL